MSQLRNACLRHYRLTDLTSDLENLYNNAHSHNEYLWQVLLKSLHYDGKQINNGRTT